MARAGAGPGAGVRYLEAPARRVLNPIRRSGPTASAGPYLTCELACVYCSAHDLAEPRAGGPTDFEREVRAEVDAPARLREEVERLAKAGHVDRPILLGTGTDPYQPLERTARVTRDMLEALARVDGVRVAVATRSDLVLRDLDLLKELGRRGHLRVHVSLCTVDAGLARLLEPRAPSPERRLRAVEVLARAGVPVGVHLMPVLPGITDAPREVRAAIWAARNAGARWLTAQVLFLRGATRESFFAWLERERPDLVRRYRRWYRGAQAAEGVQDRVRRVVEALRRQVGLPAELPWPEAAAAERQLQLFGEHDARLAPLGAKTARAPLGPDVAEGGSLAELGWGLTRSKTLLAALGPDGRREGGARGAPAARPARPLPCLPADPAALLRPGRAGVA